MLVGQIQPENMLSLDMVFRPVQDALGQGVKVTHMLMDTTGLLELYSDVSLGMQ